MTCGRVRNLDFSVRCFLATSPFRFDRNGYARPKMSERPCVSPCVEMLEFEIGNVLTIPPCSRCNACRYVCPLRICREIRTSRYATIHNSFYIFTEKKSLRDQLLSTGKNGRLWVLLDDRPRSGVLVQNVETTTARNRTVPTLHGSSNAVAVKPKVAS